MKEFEEEMVPATTSNWLSFSVSPMEMLRSSQSTFMSYEEGSSTDSPHYLFDNFYANVYGNTKSHVIFTEEDTETNQNQQQTMTNSSYSYTNFFNPHTHHTQTIPKLEDFFASDNSVSMVPFSDSKTETQDSTLTHMYENSVYFNDQQDLKSITGMQTAFSTNSGSDVDDSVSITMNNNQLSVGGGGEFGSSHCIESVNELGFCPGGILSLGMNQSCSEKAIVSVDDSKNSKKVCDTTFGQRTSIYRGVTRHRWTGRYEAHLWDNSCRREGQARKGRQVYLGGYDKEDKAARAYDLAALKYWGPAATTNFPVSSYMKEVEEMQHVSKQEFIASLRRKSSGFSRGASIYRGVTRHHQQGRWQARIGRVAGNKDLYLGTFATEEEAAEAYDIAAIKFRGVNAVTNFEMIRYDVETISSSSLPIGGAAKRLKLSLEREQQPLIDQDKKPQCSSATSNISFAAIQPGSSVPCGTTFDGSTSTIYKQNLFQHYQPNTAAASESPVSTSSGTNPVTFMPNPAEYFLWAHQTF